MNYQETLEYINSLSTFGMKLGLERLKELLGKMNNPQKQLKFVHIAGTNGKGSTTMMTANILKKAGYKTGVYISPYVLCFRERMQCNGTLISERELSECATFVRSLSQEMTLNCSESPTQFEIETATALEWFHRKKCDIVCLEVGLGGRFDATNVIDAPIVSAITSISLDHTAVLGDTIEEIAFEKAGIIKGGTTVMYPLQEKAAADIIKNKCRETNSTLVIPKLEKLRIEEDAWPNSTFHYDGLALQKSLYGKFQIYNAITACEIARNLKTAGYPNTEEDIAYGIAHTKFPARMEVFSQNPLIVLDGAHNPSGAEALEDMLKQLSNKTILLIMGILKDKDYANVVQSIAPYVSHFFSVSIAHPRALSAAKLAAEAEKYTDSVEVCENASHAVHMALHALREEDVLVICGSLYLASEIRPILIEKTGKEEQAV